MSYLSSVEYQPHPGYLDATTLIHLLNGPTVYFKLTSIELSKRILVSPPKTPFVEDDR